MSIHKKFESDRRDFLKQLMVGTGVASSGLLNVFITNMMANIFQSATAHAAGEEAAFQDFKLISLILSGGAPRYYWDLPINPNGTSDLTVNNPMVVNRFKKNNDGSFTPYYATTKVGNHHMPHVWSSNIPTTFGIAPMKNLAQNMFILRGLDLQIDSHELDRDRQVAPIPGGVSLTGLIADQATTPIPAVGRNGGGNYYKSEKGIAYVNLAGNNPFTAAMSPFAPLDNMNSLNNGAVEQAIDAALKKMAAASSDKGKFLPSTFATRFNAKKMMMKRFGSLQDNFNQLRNKYLELISRSFAAQGSLSLSGVDDYAIAGNGSASFRLQESEFFNGSDIRTITDERTGISDLAESMAIAEYMAMEGLSSSINVISSGFVQTLYQKTINTVSGVTRINTRVNHSMDVHFTGAHMATILFSRYYRAVSACLYELITQLNSKNIGGGKTLFDKTVIAVNSEFNRLPRMDGSGSDHGWRGSNYTLFSGMVPELTIAGNIHTNGDRRGTWGHGAPLTELGGREAIIGNAASTVATLLEVKTPTPNDQSFVYKEGGKAKLSIKSLKNVA